MNKNEILTKQIVEFENSEKSVEDYRKLFVKVVSATKQGSGLMWSDVEKCISNAILQADLDNSLKE